MEPFEIAISIAWVAMAAALVYGFSVAWRHVMRDKAPLRIFRMLERQGVPRGALEAARPDEFGRAARRCALCAGKERCEHWLEGGGRESEYRAFCPNAEFIETLKRR